MKKLLTALFVAAAATVMSAPMASQTWVSNRVNEAKFEMEARTDYKLRDAMAALNRALELLGSVSPDITNEVYVSRRGTNECYLISSYADGSFANKLVAWDKTSEKPRDYYNRELDLHIYEYKDFTEVTVKTNTYTSVTTTPSSEIGYEVVSVTNKVPVTEYTTTPIWVPESVDQRVFEYWDESSYQYVYITNNIVTPAYISGYDTTVTTNGYEYQVYDYTNTVYTYSMETNSFSFVKVYPKTNTYTKVWCTVGGVEYPSKSKLVNWKFLLPLGDMDVYKYECNDAEWYRSLHGED